MSRPANEAFERPLALATGSSTSDTYVAPDFRTSNLVRRTQSVTEYSDVFEPGVAITTSATTMASATATATTTTTTAAVQSGAGPSSAATAAATATAPTTTVFAVAYDTSLAPPAFKRGPILKTPTSCYRVSRSMHCTARCRMATRRRFLVCCCAMTLPIGMTLWSRQ